MGKILDKLTDNPLFLPKGSVRALLGIGTVSAGIYLMTEGNLSFEQFITMTTIVFAFYFGQKKSTEKVELTSEEKESICE